MAFNGPFLRSPPFEFNWLGWRATGGDLARAGWRFKGEMHGDDLAYRVLAKHEHSGAVLGAYIHSHMFREAMQQNHWRPYGPVPMAMMPTEFRYMQAPPIQPPFDGMEDLDMRPQFVETAFCRPADLFAKATPTGQPDVEQLAFEAEQIPEVLARIRELQAPRAREILHRSIREAEDRKRIVTPIHQVFHANIVQVEEANAA